MLNPKLQLNFESQAGVRVSGIDSRCDDICALQAPVANLGAMGRGAGIDSQRGEPRAVDSNVHDLKAATHIENAATVNLTESIQRGRMGKWAHLDWTAAREREAGVVESFGVFGAPVERSTVTGGTELPVLEVCAVKAVETATPQARVRLVLHGGREREVVDGSIVNHAPEADLQAVSPAEVRSVTVVAKMNGLFSAKADVQGAYLNTPCSQVVHARLPLWLLVRLFPNASTMKHPVCPLLRMLYGKQDSGFAWDRLLATALTDLGWSRDLAASPSVWRQDGGAAGTAFLAVYVDDVLIAAGNVEAHARLYRDISARFPLDDLTLLEDGSFEGVVTTSANRASWQTRGVCWRLSSCAFRTN